MRLIPRWWLLAVPVLLWCLGATANAVVVGLNHGLMPALWGYDCDYLKQVLWARQDFVHTCMTPQTRLNFLADWIREVDGWASPGDLLIDLFELLWLPMFSVWATLMVTERNHGRRRA